MTGRFSDIRATSYWLEGPAPLPPLPEMLPRRVDVAVTGAGYNGLNAAVATARGGRATLIFDAESPGFGCSTRNGGQISTSIKPTLETEREIRRGAGPRHS